MTTTIIAIAAQKGGVGKTTSTIALASYLTRLGKKTLVIDIDAQRNSSLVLLEGHDALHEDQTIAILLKDNVEDYSRVVHKTKVEHLDIIPSHSRLSEADVILSQLMAREVRLKMMIEKLNKKYDYILIDCPPNVNWIPINAFVAAQFVLIPVSPNAFDLEGIRLTLNTMRSVQKYNNPNLRLLGLLMTLYDHRNSISAEIYTLLKNQFKEFLFDTKIPMNTDLQKANAHKQDIYTFNPNATGAIAYKSFIEKEFLPRLQFFNEKQTT